MLLLFVTGLIWIQYVVTFWSKVWNVPSISLNITCKLMTIHLNILLNFVYQILFQGMDKPKRWTSQLNTATCLMEQCVLSPELFVFFWNWIKLKLVSKSPKFSSLGCPKVSLFSVFSLYFLHSCDDFLKSSILFSSHQCMFRKKGSYSYL